jgi:ATP diphosphatase
MSYSKHQAPVYELADLLNIMKSLRDPERGCPWDLQQTINTIIPYTLEEVYEVIEAIESNDYLQLKDELGDLLFQIIFYTQLTQEKGQFGFTEVVDNLCHKLLRRHPHVFPEATILSAGQMVNEWKKISADEVAISWEAIKAEEKVGQLRIGLLESVPTTFPALMRSYKLQKKAASTGFDWREIGQLWEKLAEEEQELSQAIATKDRTAIEDELGDLLFTVVNLSRHLQINPETALRGANRKFTRRFHVMEELAKERSLNLSLLDEEGLEDLWIEAKKKIALAVN